MLDALDTIVQADCLQVLSAQPDGCVQLIYLDPPFNTRTTRKTARAAFADVFGTAADYVAWMRPRVEHMRRVLAAHGSLFFHCDWRTGHHVRLMLDEVFGVDGGAISRRHRRRTSGVFVNQIIWHYGLGAARARRRLLTKHDVIFWYANSRDYTFNLIREAPTPAMQAKYCHTDAQGNRYMMSYGKRYILKGGKPLDDVWDIPAIAPTAAERTGYPTQKPLALLCRIVQLASNAGDVVLDPFCGSGTTLVAAQRLGRRWIGIDVNPQAVAIARQRLGL